MSNELISMKKQIEALIEAKNTQLSKNNDNDSKLNDLHNTVNDKLTTIHNTLSDLFEKYQLHDGQMQAIEKLVSDEHIEQMRSEHLEQLNAQKHHLKLLATHQEQHNHFIMKQKESLESNELIQMKNRLNELYELIKKS
jgi:hypothetical protein